VEPLGGPNGAAGRSAPRPWCGHTCRWAVQGTPLGSCRSALASGPARGCGRARAAALARLQASRGPRAPSPRTRSRRHSDKHDLRPSRRLERRGVPAVGERAGRRPAGAVRIADRRACPAPGRWQLGGCEGLRRARSAEGVSGASCLSARYAAGHRCGCSVTCSPQVPPAPHGCAPTSLGVAGAPPRRACLHFPDGTSHGRARAASLARGGSPTSGRARRRRLERRLGHDASRAGRAGRLQFGSL